MQRWTDRGAAIIAQGDKIILMRRERGFGKNKQIYYTIPGGGREEGEKIEETAIREIKEELGVRVRIGALIDTIEYDYPNFHLVMYCFFCELIEGEIKLLEAESGKWFTKETLYEVSWLPADVILVARIKELIC